MAPKNKKAAAKKKNEKMVKQKAAQSAKEALERKKAAGAGEKETKKTAEKVSAVKNISKTSSGKTDSKKEQQRLREKKEKEKRELKQEKRREKQKKAKDKQKAAETAAKNKAAEKKLKLEEKQRRAKQKKEKKQKPEKARETAKEKAVKEQPKTKREPDVSAEQSKPLPDVKTITKTVTIQQASVKTKSPVTAEPAAVRVVSVSAAEIPVPGMTESTNEPSEPVESVEEAETEDINEQEPAAGLPDDLADCSAEEEPFSPETEEAAEEPEIDEISEYAEISEPGESVEETETEDINEQEPAAGLPDDFADCAAEEEPFAPDTQEAAEEPEIDEISEYAEISEPGESFEETETEDINEQEPAAGLPDDFADYSANEEPLAPDTQEAAEEPETDEIFEYTETPEPDEYCEAAKPEIGAEPLLIPVSEEPEEEAVESVEPTEETDVWQALATPEETEKIIEESLAEVNAAVQESAAAQTGAIKDEKAESVISAFSRFVYKIFNAKNKIRNSGKSVKHKITSFKDLPHKTKTVVTAAAAVAAVAIGAVIAVNLLTYDVPESAVPVYMGRDEAEANTRDINITLDQQLTLAKETDAKGDKKAFKFFMEKEITVEEWYSNINFTLANVDSNNCSFLVTIVDEDGNAVFRSLGIKPGRYLPFAQLGKEYPYGTYDFKVIVAAYNSKTFKEIGVQYTDLKLVIGIEKPAQETTKG